MDYIKIKEAIEAVEKAHSEIEKLLGKDANPQEAMSLLQISSSIKGLKREVEKAHKHRVQ